MQGEAERALRCRHVPPRTKRRCGYEWGFIHLSRPANRLFLKSVIAHAVFGRRPDYDPKQDSIVPALARSP